GNPQLELQEKGVIDSGCSRHMTGNKSYLSDYEEIDGGFVAFGGNTKGGKIIGKGKIRTGKLDFEDVYFVKELKFNLFSVSQMCDKKNIVLFTDTECVVLSPDFKLFDESQVLLRVPRKNNMYSVELKNVVPSGGLTCLFGNATLDESNLWHRRLGHINFKTMNKLVKGNLVKVEGEGSGQPTELQHTPTTASPSHIEPIPTIASSSNPKKTKKHRKTKRKATKISQSSGPTTLVADETIHEERGDNVERAATTATSLDAEQGSVNTLGSGEDSMKLTELMELYTKLSERVLTLENIKTAQDLEITNLKKRVKKLEKKKKSRNPQLKKRLFKFQEDAETQGRYGHDISNAEVTTASVPSDVDVSAASPTRPVDDSTTDDITLAETLMNIKSSASRSQKDKGVMFKDPSEPTTTLRSQPRIPAKDKGKGIIQEPEKLVKVKGKDQIKYDTDVAQRLQAEEELTVEEQSKLLAEFIETRRKYFAAKRAKENRNKPPTKTRQRSLMCTYLKNMEGYKHKDFKGKSFDAIKKMFDKAYKRVNTFVAMDSEVVESSGKKDESSGKEAVSKKRQIAPNDDKAINIEPLATKSPIVDWETQILREELFYYQIKRANGSSKVYKVLYAMLNDFDRQDLIDLYRLVKERFKTTQQKGYDILLWRDLMTIFELSEQDELYRNQQNYSLISWELIDSCGVHSLLMDTISIHMLVERIYPLIQLTLERMLNTILQVDQDYT
ncbi:ribonuclease H-like domain-containing protein, partial [Tanacetum coccineum]